MTHKARLGRARIAWCAALLGVAAAVAVGAGVAEAGKKKVPPPPPPPSTPPVDSTTGGGTIFFPKNADPSLWTMAADGTGKTVVPAGVTREPGYLLHEGHRWFLRPTFVAGTYPDASPRREISAVRDDGAVTVQLTGNADVKSLSFHSSSLAILDCRGQLRWAKDDSFFSYAAVDWSGGGAPVSRLFLTRLSFDATGAPMASAAPVPVVTLPYVSAYGTYSVAAVASHDWSPLGGEVAWTESAYNGIGPIVSSARVTSLAGTVTTVASNRLVWSWSADGKLLLEDNSSVIESVDPTGANRTLLVAAVAGESAVFGRAWSPTGSHFTYMVNDLRTNVRYLYRARSDGTYPTNLTAEITTQYGCGPGVAWR